MGSATFAHYIRTTLSTLISSFVMSKTGYDTIRDAVVSAGYPALLSSSYFERINDDDDFNVRSKANMSQLNLPHGTDN